MANPPKKFSVADHCLINAATQIGVARVRDASAMQEALATFKEVLPACTRENLHIGPLAEACEAVMQHYPAKRSSAEMTTAWFDLANALGKIHRWKHAQALDAWQQSQEQK